MANDMKKELRKVNEAIEYLAKLQDSYSDKTFGLDKLKKGTKEYKIAKRKQAAAQGAFATHGKKEKTKRAAYGATCGDGNDFNYWWRISYWDHCFGNQGLRLNTLEKILWGVLISGIAGPTFLFTASYWLGLP